MPSAFDGDATVIIPGFGAVRNVDTELTVLKPCRRGLHLDIILQRGILTVCTVLTMVLIMLMTTMGNGEAMVVMSMTSPSSFATPGMFSLFRRRGVMMIALAVIIMIRFH